jgi:hypothetical protein
VEAWPAFYEPGLSWLAQVEQAIHRHAGDQAGALVAITNAIEYQFEVGAHVPTLTNLLAALRTLAQAHDLNLKVLHLDADAPIMVQRLAPSTDVTVRPSPIH